MAMEGGGGGGPKPPLPADIEELHAEVVARGEETYTDPETGYMVFTEVFHRKRGYCCGNRCRHCPYDWVHVGDPKAVRAAAAAAKEREQNGTAAAVADGDGASSQPPAPPAQQATDAASAPTGCLTMGGSSALLLGRKRGGGLGIAVGPARRTLTTRPRSGGGPVLQMIKGSGGARPRAVQLLARGAASLLLGAFGGSA